MMFRPGAIVFSAVALEEGLDRLGVRDEDHLAGAVEGGAERLAELAAPVLHEGDRPHQEARGLHRLGQRHAWRSGHLRPIYGRVRC